MHTVGRVGRALTSTSSVQASRLYTETVHQRGVETTSLDKNTAPMETFYDGYVVNAVMDAAYRSVESRKWEPIEIKEEKMPDGKLKVILKDKQTGKIFQIIQ